MCEARSIPPVQKQNKMCSEKGLWRNLLLFIGIIHSAQAAYLHCYKETLDDPVVVPLKQPQLLLNSTCINRTLTTIMYSPGYRGKVAGPATTAMLSAYLANKTTNLILVNWEKEAATGILGIQASYVVTAVPNAKIVGEDLGQALTIFAGAGISMALVHLIGFSLGAHLMAFAGRKARANGHIVARITGLDPARELFEGPLGLPGLDRYCARFVDVIHCDPGGYAINASAGTADFWPNYTGRSGSQPGCPVGNFEMFTPEDLCSHDRSWKLYVESIGLATAFPAAGAPDHATWVRTAGQSTQIAYMGESVDTSATGNYYLTTGPTPPYSLGMDGLYPPA